MALLAHGTMVARLEGMADGSQQVSYGAQSGLSSFVRQLSARPRMGLFSVVSQISPNGAGDYEDLSVLDPTDSEQWLLMVVVQRGDDYYVLRRLYCGEG
jgi:hypothetical protein